MSLCVAIQRCTLGAISQGMQEVVRRSDDQGSEPPAMLAMSLVCKRLGLVDLMNPSTYSGRRFR
jgi:hypothetical protein